MSRQRRCDFCGGLLDFEDLSDMDAETDYPCGCGTGEADWDEHTDDHGVQQGGQGG